MSSLTAQQEEIAEVLYICKNCKKPLSKHKSTWRRHYQSCAKEFKYICHVCSKGFTMKFRMEQHIQQKHADCGGDNNPNDLSCVKREDVSPNAAASTGINLPSSNNVVTEQQQQHHGHHQQQHHQNEMVLPKPIEQQNGNAAAAMMMLNASGSNHLIDNHQQFMYHANYAGGYSGPGQSKMESFDRVFAGIR